MWKVILFTQTLRTRFSNLLWAYSGLIVLLFFITLFITLFRYYITNWIPTSFKKTLYLIYENTKYLLFWGIYTSFVLYIVSLWFFVLYSWPEEASAIPRDFEIVYDQETQQTFAEIDSERTNRKVREIYDDKIIQSRMSILLWNMTLYLIILTTLWAITISLSFGNRFLISIWISRFYIAFLLLIVWSLLQYRLNELTSLP